LRSRRVNHHATHIGNGHGAQIRRRQDDAAAWRAAALAAADSRLIGVRQIFRDVVGSVKPEHFAAEDAPLVALYARGLAQCELAAREIGSGSTDRFWIELQTAHSKP
jgi:hypothetical protein